MRFFLLFLMVDTTKFSLTFVFKHWWGHTDDLKLEIATHLQGAVGILKMFSFERYSLKMIKISWWFSGYDDMLKQAGTDLPSAWSCIKLFRDIRSTRKWIDWSLVSQKYILLISMVYIIAHQPVSNKKANY